MDFDARNYVKKSALLRVSAIGDVLGPALDGLDDLLRLPTGCGEQNMVSISVWAFDTIFKSISIFEFSALTSVRPRSIKKLNLNLMPYPIGEPPSLYIGETHSLLSMDNL